MTDQELDALMKRILIDSIKLDFDSIRKDDAPSAFSPRYQRQMRLMLKNPFGWAKKKGRPMWKTAAHRIAMVLLIISLGFGAVMVSSTTARAAFLRWVTEWYETHIVYRYAGENNIDEIPHYSISELPEGYEEYQRIEGTNYAKIIFQNDAEDKRIYLSYTYMHQGSATAVVTEGLTVESVIVNGLAGELYLSNDLDYMDNTIIWTDPNSNIQFEVDAPLDRTDILSIAEGVLPEERKK